MPSWLALLFFIVIGAFSVFMAMQCLKVKVTNRAVYFSLGAFASPRSVKIDDMSMITLRQYDGMAEFSGWGVRRNDKEDCYTVSGQDGLEIKFKDSSKKMLLIGTQQAKQLQAIVSAKFPALNKLAR